MSEEPMSEATPTGISRRRMLKRIGTGVAVAWTVPVITSMETPAFAASPGTCDCITEPCAIGNCGPPGAGCSCAMSVSHGCACFIPTCLALCSNDSDCGPGALCVEVCCGPNTCADICNGAHVPSRPARAWSRA